MQDIGQSPGKVYLLAAALALILLVVYYTPVLFWGREFFTSDHVLYFQPFASFIRDSLARGDLPLWNPYCYCGMPQIANPSPGLFYLPTALFAIFTYSRALALTMILSHLAAFSAGYLLALRVGVRPVSALVCALALGFNGYMFTLSSNYTLSATASWGFLSLALLLYLQASECWAKRSVYTALLATFVHLMIMAGRPEIYVPAFATLGLVAIYPLKGYKRVGVQKALIPLVMAFTAFALGIAMSASTLLPTYEWTCLSPRNKGLTAATAMLWSANWYDFVCVFAPQPLGDLQSPLNRLLGYVCSRPGYYVFLQSSYLGPVVTSLAILGLSSRRRLKYWILAGIILASLCALGSNTFFSRLLLEKLPFFTVLRYPVKLMVFVDLFISLLAVLGFERLLVSKGRRQEKIQSIVFAVCALVTGVLYLTRTFYAGQTFEFEWPFDWEIKYFSALFYERLFRSLFFCFLTAALLNLFFSFKHRFKPATIISLTLGALIGSLATPNFVMPPRTVSHGFYRPGMLSRKLDELGGDVRYAGFYFDPLQVPKSYRPRAQYVTGEPYMQFCRELALPNTNIGVRRVTFGYEASETKRYRESYLKALHKSSIDKKGASDKELHRFCQISATALAGSVMRDKRGKVGPLSPRYFELIEENRDFNLRLYKVKDSFARVYLSPSAIVSEKQCYLDKDDNIEIDPKTGSIFEDSKWLKEDPLTRTHKERRMAQEAEWGKIEKSTTPSAGVVIVSSGECRMLRDSNNHQSISAKLDKPGFLVLCDLFYPGWRATVDGFPAPLCRANGFMRAVYLEAGAHLVEFDYRPNSLRLALWLSCVSMLLTFAILLFGLRRFLWNCILYLSTGKWPVEKEVNDANLYTRPS